MSGPWEKYQNNDVSQPSPAQPVAGQPWTKFQDPSQSAPTDNSPQYLEQEHPDITFGQRLLIKNLAQSPEVGAAYLKQNGFDATVKNGNIYARKAGEKDFKALDPKGFDWQDLTDVAYDVPAGAITGAATAASGLVGAEATGGLGAIPAASAGGAATSAGLEGLRQKLGSYFGLPQEVSGKDVAISGAIGAATPILFGTGATGAQIAKSELAPEVAEQLRSPVARGIEKAFPYAANMSSGVPVEATKTYINENPEVKALIKEGPDAAANMAEDVHAGIKDQFFKKKNEVGAALAVQTSGNPNLISSAKIFQPIEDHIANLVSSERSLTADGQAEIEALRAELDGMKQGLPELITPKTAWELKDQLKDKSNLQNVSGTFTARYGAGASGAEKALSDAAKKSYDVANKEIQNAAGTSGLSSEYQKLSRLQEGLQKYFKNPETTERTLLTLDKQSKGAARKTVKSLDEATGDTGISDMAKKLEAYKYYQDPELLPISSGGTTSTSRTGGLSGAFGAIGSLLGEGGRHAGENIGRVVGGPAAVKTAADLGIYGSKALGAAPARVAPIFVSPWLKQKKEEQNGR